MWRLVDFDKTGECTVTGRATTVKSVQRHILFNMIN